MDRVGGYPGRSLTPRSEAWKIFWLAHEQFIQQKPKVGLLRVQLAHLINMTPKIVAVMVP